MKETSGIYSCISRYIMMMLSELGLVLRNSFRIGYQRKVLFQMHEVDLTRTTDQELSDIVAMAGRTPEQ
jgi:hypothetical protein